jgi:hypothetical protein
MGLLKDENSANSWKLIFCIIYDNFLLLGKIGGNLNSVTVALKNLWFLTFLIFMVEVIQRISIIKSHKILQCSPTSPMIFQIMVIFLCFSLRLATLLLIFFKTFFSTKRQFPFHGLLTLGHFSTRFAKLIKRVSTKFWKSFCIIETMLNFVFTYFFVIFNGKHQNTTELNMTKPKTRNFNELNPWRFPWWVLKKRQDFPHSKLTKSSFHDNNIITASSKTWKVFVGLFGLFRIENQFPSQK